LHAANKRFRPILERDQPFSLEIGKISPVFSFLTVRFRSDGPSDPGTKKEVMAADAEALLAGTGWLPVVLHVPGVTYPVDSGVAGDQDAAPVPMAAE